MGGWSRIHRSLDERRMRRAAAIRFDELDKERRRVAVVLAIAEATRAAPPASGHRLGIQFAPDEREVLSPTTVELVESAGAIGQPSGGRAAADSTTPVTVDAGTHVRWSPEVIEATTLDIGRVWITTRRVVFEGPKHTRVWSFCDLAGITVGKGASLLYLIHRTRRKTGGLRFPPHRFDEVLDHLEVALAFSRGEGEAFVHSLQDRLRALDDEFREHGGHVPVGHPRHFLGKPVDGPWVPAGIGTRFVARVVDGLVYVVVFVCATLAFSIVGPQPSIDPSTPGVTSTEFENVILGTGVACLGIFMVIESLFIASSGATFGKRRVGALVIDVRTGEPPSLGRAFLRAGSIVVLFLLWLGPIVDAVFALLDPEGRALHDRVARTLVVRRV